MIPDLHHPGVGPLGGAASRRDVAPSQHTAASRGPRADAATLGVWGATVTPPITGLCPLVDVQAGRSGLDVGGASSSLTATPTGPLAAEPWGLPCPKQALLSPHQVSGPGRGLDWALQVPKAKRPAVRKQVSWVVRGVRDCPGLGNEHLSARGTAAPGFLHGGVCWGSWVLRATAPRGPEWECLQTRCGRASGLGAHLMGSRLLTSSPPGRGLAAVVPKHVY